MSKSFYLLTAFGKDRPGMVAGVSQALYKVGGNIEDASMTRLGGEFTMMLVVSVPSNVTSASLTKTLGALEKKLGLQIAVKSVPASAASGAPLAPAVCLISVYGTDHPGIVKQVTELLAKHKINITDLQTKVSRGAKPLYYMLLEVAVSDSVDMDAFREELDELRKTLHVEISLQDIEAVAL